MYVDHFGLNDTPFSISPNPRYLYMSEKHKEALAHLLYGVGTGGGFVLLTGEVGTGKTTVCRSLLEQLPENTDVAFILNPLLDATELLESICDELSIAYIEDATSLRTLSAALYNFLLENHAKGRNTVLLIDEAQNLDIKVLELIRLLTNLETDTKKLLQIVFIGQPELNALLAKPELRQLAQRITARFHINPLNEIETQGYIKHRLKVAGLADSVGLFPTALMSDVYKRTGGIPRLINLLCDRMLLGAYAENQRRLDSKKLKQAANEVLTLAPKPRGFWPTTDGRYNGLIALSLLVIITVGFSVWIIQDNGQQQAGTAKVQMPNPSAETTINSHVAESDGVSENIAVKTPDPDLLGAEQATPLGNSYTDNHGINYADDYTYNNEAQALSALFHHLGAAQLAGPAPCEDTAGSGWHCTQVSVKNWKGFLQYNRPSVLKFVTENGDLKYAVVTQISANRASVEYQGKIVEKSLIELGNHWTGDLTLLWQGPEGYQKPLAMGDKGELVTWIAQRFADLDQQTQALTDDRFNAALAKRVKIFQQQHHLEADGIVGLQTLLKMNEALKQGITLQAPNHTQTDTHNLSLDTKKDI